ncbi:MAG: hypothetical protein SGJ05_09905 [bacterium]|nr:hypothetical protein [bacterium]
MPSTKQIPYESEIARKSIHLASLLIPIVYLHVDHTTGLIILAWMTVVSLSVDLMMRYHGPTRRVLLALVGPIMRTHELRRDKLHLTGASWVLIAALVTMAVFPTSVAITAFTVLIVSDTFAALVGRRVAGPGFLDKSVIGTATFILTAWLVVGVYGSIYSLPWTYYLAGIIGCIVGGVVEAASTRLKVDDNLSIPFSIAVTMSVLGWIFVMMGYQDFFRAIP